MIRIEGVSKAYGTKPVLRDLSVDIPAGGVTSVIGANGAGKSTLLGVMSRLLPLDAGRVLIDDLDVRTADQRHLARKLAVLRQENHITMRLTVRELAEFGRYPHTGGRLKASDHVAVNQALAYLDLVDISDRYLDTLSGGQRQRAFIAMTLAQDTDYLLLDEPLNNLDLLHSVEAMHLLRRIAGDLGKTVVLVIHDINFAAVHSDAVLALKDGRVAHHGTPQAVLTTPNIREVFGVNVQVEEIGGFPVALYYRGSRWEPEVTPEAG